jgi:hydrogenase expression/formation protein HypE
VPPNENSFARRELSTPRKGFDAGKIPPNVLTRSVYPFLGKKSKRVLLGPGIGRDAAIVHLDKRILVFSTDPITGASRHIGAHAVHVNANDIAVAGAVPLWFLCTTLVPPGTNESVLRGIMREVDKEARKLGISVVGGHTEATPELKHPVVAGFMVGESKSGKYLTAAGAHEGDALLMTKTAGVEGTAVLAADHAALLKQKGVDSRTINRARVFSNKISVVKEALIASKLKGVTAMHDPTEGGVLNGLWELAEASGKGIVVESDKIPIASETGTISAALKLDPLKLLGSGSLVIAVAASKKASVQGRLDRNGIRVTEIGRLTGRDKGRFLLSRGRLKKLTAVYRDELYKI